MSCYLCGDEAVSRCFNCGELICASHGKDNCLRCETGIAAGDPRPDRITEHPGGRMQKQGWWRPREAEAYQPPACYACKGLCRSRCQRCGQPYCAEHAGRKGLCQECDRTDWLGPVVLATLAVLIALLFLWGYLAG